ncbi:hypothetical protein CKAN_02731700 [Cinnamomum micranthum f. kanehirae]|uniref:Uncharacterized protein n=1 Tax=Cinnamomum micranthum f. kanehirae TaxID=337451 RepID=A0A443Q498_9MAGN|nr:hypothetical protein CKAN_02731700 [Cinnamomum micranthum f. kanehirae]
MYSVAVISISRAGVTDGPSELSPSELDAADSRTLISECRTLLRHPPLKGGFSLSKGLGDVILHEIMYSRHPEFSNAQKVEFQNASPSKSISKFWNSEKFSWNSGTQDRIMVIVFAIPFHNCSSNWNQQIVERRYERDDDP